MAKKNETLASNESSLRRRDLLKAGVAGAAALALYPGSMLQGQREQGNRINAGAGPSRIIDIHAHIASTDAQRYPITPIGGTRSDWSKEQSVTFERMIAAMDESGVYKAALVQSSTTYGNDDSYVSDSVALQPKRVTGVFSVDMLADDAVDKVRYWATERKLGGLRIFTNVATPAVQASWLLEPKLVPGLKCAQSLGLPVCISLRMPGLPALVTLVKRFPKIRFIIDHMIEPPIAEGVPYAGSQFLFDMAQYENVYLKVTTQNIRAFRTGKGTPETFFPLLVGKFGASRIAWGSNYPANDGTLRDMVAEAQTAFRVLSEKDREWIFTRTAQSLYPMLAG
jgi:L-fuconolactonase